MFQKLHSKSWLSTVILAALLAILSVFSLFVGATDISISSLFSGGMELKIFLLARIPRLLAILCTGIGMSVAGLIMQQLCMNKFVSPTTGATIQSAQFGIALAMVFFPTMGLWVRTLFAIALAVVVHWHSYSSSSGSRSRIRCLCRWSVSCSAISSAV